MRSFLLLVIATVVVSGCTFKAIKSDPDTALTAPSKPPFIVLGRVAAADPEWDAYRQPFVDGFATWFKKNPGVPDTITDRAAEFPAGAVVLMATITEVDEGSWPLRSFVGMGAGRAHVSGDFQIVDATGQPLTRFNARETYLGGFGLRGPALLSMEDLVRRLSETVAKSVRRWANGQPVE